MCTSRVNNRTFACTVHCNDLIVTLEDMCEQFNYADDNTATCHEKTVAEVRIKAETIIDKMLDLFCVNKMNSNLVEINFSIFYLTEMDF